jgi:phosphatidylinositol glycan class W
VALFVAVLDISARWSGVVGTLLLCAYQIALSYFGIAEYIVNAERTNFFSQNREGILSLVGYVALFLISTQIGATSAPICLKWTNSSCIASLQTMIRQDII